MHLQNFIRVYFSKSTLNDIHNKLVATRVDKANQPFYALVLINELGLDHNNTDTNHTYILVHKTNIEVISGHVTFLRI